MQAALEFAVPFALAPVAVVVTVVCAFLSLLLPAGHVRRSLQGLTVLQATLFIGWVVSGAAKCVPRCDRLEDLAGLIALVVGPGVLLLSLLLGALALRPGA